MVHPVVDLLVDIDKSCRSNLDVEADIRTVRVIADLRLGVEQAPASSEDVDVHIAAGFRAGSWVRAPGTRDRSFGLEASVNGGRRVTEGEVVALRARVAPDTGGRFGRLDRDSKGGDPEAPSSRRARV